MALPSLAELAARDWHAARAGDALDRLVSDAAGLTAAEARRRYARFGANELPRRPPPRRVLVYLRQFASPLIYLLLGATALSLAIGDLVDAVFIFAVLQINAIVGAVQEWKAETGAAALERLVTSWATVRRDGRRRRVDGKELVPGDIVELDSGAMIPADLRLLSTHHLAIDESRLTGESTPVEKDAEPVLPADTVLADRRNMGFAGTIVQAGRGAGIVVRTGLHSEVGRIAQALAATPAPVPPLVQRLSRFARRLGFWTMAAAALMAALQVWQGAPLGEVALVAVALAVSAIPEGLPVAITVALSISAARMARRHVIVRALPAVEALGSCTLIASDKTGTLTCNVLTARRLALPTAQGALAELTIGGEGYSPSGDVLSGGRPPEAALLAAAKRLALAGVLCNEANYEIAATGPVHLGDTVDVAFLVLGHKLGLTRAASLGTHAETGIIAYEPGRRFAASFNRVAGGSVAHVKGAPEAVLAMCADVSPAAQAYAARLAAEGYRVLAVAAGPIPGDAGPPDAGMALRGLTLLGFVGLIDPVRAEVPEALRRCARAGVAVRMITGDHPATALTIGREIGIAAMESEVMSGAVLAQLAPDPAGFDAAVAAARIFARVEPTQKLDIVRALQRSGHVVAVTGDGVNDAPALHAAEIGVAMGAGGTDAARGAADIILTDDNFASIVAGIEEGRVAYDNVRKVVLMLLSTGVAEVALFFLALGFGLPLPLFALQLLWLNLVTNGIQDVALAFEAGEPEILARPPRAPGQPIFDRPMLQQVALSGAVIGGIGFAFFAAALALGIPEAEARNLLLLLIVSFENAHVLNCRSETRSILRIPLRANPFVVVAVFGAQGVHIAAMHVPGLSDALAIAPVSAGQWAVVAALATTLIATAEAYKWWRRHRLIASRDAPVLD